jgi:hypothetical protein
MNWAVRKGGFLAHRPHQLATETVVVVTKAWIEFPDRSAGRQQDSSFSFQRLMPALDLAPGHGRQPFQVIGDV